MLKSKIYKLAQIAVINSSVISPENKIEILRVLMADEDVEKYMEEKTVKEE